MIRLKTVLVAMLGLAGIAALGVGCADQRAAEPLPVTSAAPALSAAVPGTSAPPVSSPGKDTLTSGDLLPTSPPTRVTIPALDISVPVTGLGLQPDRSMEVPTDAKTVGWYTGAPTPGSLGPAVLAGHVDYQGVAGSFARLATLRPGDEIQVARRDGTTALFTVTHVDRYAKDQFPSEAVYGPIDHAGLRLITCGGAFNHGTGHYQDNIVAYATLRTASP